MESDSDIVPAAITEDVQKARDDYQALLAEASKVLSAHKKKLKSSIEKARPYYELQSKKKKLLIELQKNSEAYIRVRTEHDEAKSILNSYNIDVAKFDDSDESKLEIINNAIQKVNSTKAELADLKAKHAEVLHHCVAIDESISYCRSSASSAIRKSQ
ncbi:hypothetical protein Aperf_G00000019720 [Anoplocephala perfoliata]